MQQRQPRLGDVLDDYCPRERRLTNHVVVAMIGDAVKQTRCTTCESDHEYKHAAVPRQRKKSEQSTLYSQVLAAVTPRKVVPAAAAAVPTPDIPTDHEHEPEAEAFAAPPQAGVRPGGAAFDALFELPHDGDGNRESPVEEGPAHRRLIRAQLPKHEGQMATTRQAPDFTIRQPNPGRHKRFGGRPPRGGAQFQGGRQGGGMGNTNGNGNARPGGGQRPGGRPQGRSRPANRHGGGGRNRSK